MSIYVFRKGPPAMTDESKLDCLLDTFAKVSRRTPREMRDGDTCESDEIEIPILQA